LGLLEDVADLAIELSSRSDVGAERLLDDDPHPATLRVASLLAGLGQTRRTELLDDLGVEDGRNREVEEAVPGGAASEVDAVEPLGEVRVRARFVELAGVVLDPLAE